MARITAPQKAIDQKTGSVPALLPGNLHVANHVLIEHKLTYMRDVQRPPHEFSRLLKEVGMLMALQVSSTFPTKSKTVQTHHRTNSNRADNEFDGQVIDAHSIVIVPILRAGLVMAEGLREAMPFAIIGHLGLHQDKMHAETIEYLVKLPKPENRIFILVDPMIGTGNTATRAIDILMACGISSDNIRFVSLLAGKETAIALARNYSNVQFYISALDPIVNGEGRVVPGVGIIGQRVFGI